MTSHCATIKAALSTLAFVAFAGCAYGPAVRVDGDAIRFKPAARTEYLGPYTLANARSRTAIKAMRPAGDEWVVPIAEIGTDAAGACLAIADAGRRIVSLRSGPDSSGFRFAAYADLAAAERSWRLAQSQAEQLRASFSDQRAAYYRAVNWLNESPYFRDNQCLRPQRSRYHQDRPRPVSRPRRWTAAARSV